MTTPILHLRRVREEIAVFHQGGDGSAGRLLLRAEGLALGRPEPLSPEAEFFAVGAIDPMVEVLMRLNREPGRNVRVSPKVYDVDLGGEVLGTLGFAVVLQDDNAEGWLQRVPYAPTAVLAEPNGAVGGKNITMVWVFDHLEPEAQASAVASHIAAAAGGAVAELWPVAGSLSYPTVGEPQLVELLLPWQETRCSLDQIMQLIEAEARASRVRINAKTPGDLGRDPGPQRDPPETPGKTAAAVDDMMAALVELGRVLERRYRSLEIGSDVEISKKISRELIARFGRIVWDEGSFWRYDARRWMVIDREAMRRLLHNFDGAIYPTATGKPETVRLSRTRIDSIVRELEAVLAEKDFFADPAVGINVENGFVHFDRHGKPELVAHSPEHRCRHVLPGKWNPELDQTAEDPAEDSLLFKLLNGCFQNDPDAAEKKMLVAEIGGSAATGIATKLPQPKAMILAGEKANNGKSALLDLLRSMLPTEAHVALGASKFGDDRHIVHLVGKLLNAPDELSGAAVISSDVFKKVVTGEPCTGRDVYRSAVEFRPVAQHVFACNVLPLFTGGFDRGVQRRLQVLQFNRVIPEDERVEKFGQLVAREEPDRVIAFFVAGASRLLQNRRFTEPVSSRQALQVWLYSGDPVLAWVRARLVPADSEEKRRLGGISNPKSSVAYNDFKEWAKEQGYRENLLPAVNGFSGRVKANADYVEVKHRNVGNRLLGCAIVDRQEQDEDQAGAE
jgi:phage/plasmid-associated DNA primase